MSANEGDVTKHVLKCNWVISIDKILSELKCAVAKWNIKGLDT